MKSIAAIATLLLGAASSSSSAHAQNHPVAPVVVGTERVPEALAALSRLGVELQNLGVELLDPKEASAAFRLVHSHPISPPTRARVREYGQAIETALADAQAMRASTAEQILREFGELPAPVRDWIVWRTKTARTLVDYCLQRAIDTLREKPQSDGAALVGSCLADVPSARANDNLIKLGGLADAYEAAQQARAKRGKAILRIEAPSAPGQCRAVVNGLSEVDIPGQLEGPMVGKTLRVLVTCEGQARVYAVDITKGLNMLTINAGLHARVRTTDTHLALHYDRQSEKRNHLVADAQAIAVAVGASRALVVESIDPTTLAVRTTSDEGEVVQAELPLHPTEAQVIAMAQKLAAEQASKPTQPEPVPEQPGNAALPAAVATAVAGAVSLGLGWASYDLRQQNAQRLQAGQDVYLPLYDDSGRNVVVFGGFGAALLSTTVPMVLPDHDDAPALTWIASIVGAGIVGTGIYLTAAGGSCTRTGCPDGGPDSALGPLVMAHGIPLLMVPITQAIRSALGSSETTPSLQASESGAMLHISGNL